MTTLSLGNRSTRRKMLNLTRVLKMRLPEQDAAAGWDRDSGGIELGGTLNRPRADERTEIFVSMTHF